MLPLPTDVGPGTTNPALPTEGSPAVPFKLPFPTLQHSTDTQRQFRTLKAHVKSVYCSQFGSRHFKNQSQLHSNDLHGTQCLKSACLHRGARRIAAAVSGFLGLREIHSIRGTRSVCQAVLPQHNIKAQPDWQMGFCYGQDSLGPPHPDSQSVPPLHLWGSQLLHDNGAAVRPGCPRWLV